MAERRTAAPDDVQFAAVRERVRALDERVGALGRHL
jgi:hypothetical protein